MPPRGLKNIAVPEELHNRLKARKRPHQALAGVIEELLNAVENNSNVKNKGHEKQNIRDTTQNTY